MVVINAMAACCKSRVDTVIYTSDAFSSAIARDPLSVLPNYLLDVGLGGSIGYEQMGAICSEL